MKNNGEISDVFKFSFRLCDDSGETLEFARHHKDHNILKCTRDEHVVSCHPACIALSESRPRDVFINALAPSFSLPRSQANLRQSRLQFGLAYRLGATWPQLPLELRHQISSFLLSEYAVVLADSAWKNRQAPSTVFRSSETVWATYTIFEGV